MQPARQPKRQRRKEARPAEIIAAALKLFSERGFAATRLEDVAEAAGVSKATIYLYFESKEDLFKAIIREIATPRLDAIEALVEGFDGRAADLVRGLTERARAIAGSPDVRAVIKLVVSEAGNFPDVAAFYRDEMVLRGLRNIARIIERGIASGEFRRCDPVATGQSIILPIIMNALAREVFGETPELDPERFLPSHLDFVLHGLAADKETR
ncbi:MAG: TetR/AcrR family transcriptional regulator [Parvibaculum sp.]|uniref:TetR/AcrR family transcriptional regulator n=1 Tax=Parvibaculum sp. TaxID=2024848 RepID=UPI0028482944|nr:TetR/AcrR family transcriptional regulator [Parvibaculum sp.]MDR3498132.1 TetR/AcrR family transcriptional regulator [Parvibaculum sp.]